MPFRFCPPIVWVVGVCLLIPQVRAQAAIRYVNDDAGGSNNGLSWANAYNSLQTALLDPGATEIWVAAGTYTPGASRFDAFILKNGVAIHGGFAGTETKLSDRDGSAGPSILSGDIGVAGNNADNSYHVVFASGVNATAVLEGFTITGGSAEITSLARHGGGMRIEGPNTSPQILNCVFRDNSARDAGGGMYSYLATPTVVNCVFRDNSTTLGDGGGLFTDRGQAKIVNCTFIQNTAADEGGGVFTYQYGGVSCPDNANFYNCIFHGNTDIDGNVESAQISAEEIICPPEFNRAVLNRALPNPFILTHSCIENWQGTLGGATNFGDDPQFADAAGRILTSSPCVDAGTNAALPADTLDLDDDFDTAETIPTDIGFLARTIHASVDVGAFEAQFDCNSNGVLDSIDIGVTSTDCNANGIPDECDVLELDCNANGYPDDCDIAAASSTDCNLNAVPDDCDIAGSTSSDCNNDGFPDDCEIAFHLFILDNGSVGTASKVHAFNVPTGGTTAPIITSLPPAGNDRGMTILPGSGRLLINDVANAKLLDVDVFFKKINATINNDRPLLEIAYDWDANQLYATTDGGALYRVDMTFGFTTFIRVLPGDSPADWVCLAYDSRTKRLLGASQTEQRMYAIDPTTGDAVAFPSAFGVGLGDIAVDPADGTIYGIGDGGALYAINRATGEAGSALINVANIANTAAGIAVSFASECNGNGILDSCDIAGGFATDCNNNTVPDSCEADCNQNGIADECDVLAGGDFDGDGDVDLADAAAMVDCLSGPNTPPAPAVDACVPTCLQAFDMDQDGDVDLQDYAGFLLAFTG
ncbi:MAG: hypothetical protein H6817_01040 [Phycisphaerales bacterium]|nr:hypothetical protein [Phycisphaerales bacterium]